LLGLKLFALPAFLFDLLAKAFGCLMFADRRLTMGRLSM
jgi:hypothetical protein